MTTSKKRKLGTDQEFEEITAAEYEEDLSDILARIKEQEDSEAFARQLEAEWNNVPSTSANVSKGSQVVHGVERDVIVIPDNEQEDDEEMARRLAREWGEQDGRNLPPQSVSSSSSASRCVPPKRRSSTGLSPPEAEMPPDEKLHEYKPLFTQGRSCTKCTKMVESPRGQVCHYRCPPCLALHCIYL